MKKVLIAAPVQDRLWILKYYFKAIEKLDYNHKNLGLFFVLNECDKSVVDYFKIKKTEFEEKFREFEFIEINIGMPKDSRTNIRRKRTYSWLAILRNIIIEYFLNKDYNYLFMVDSDIILKPESLKKILGYNKDIISIAIANDRGRGYATNVLVKCGLSYKHVPLKDIPERYPMKCDLTGACILIKREVLEKHCRYRRTDIGEDLGFCEEARDRGFTLWAIKGFAEHIMEPFQLSSLENL